VSSASLTLGGRAEAADPVAAAGTAAAAVEATVRELVRRRGLDPVAEPAVVARLVDEVVADYLDRAGGSQLPAPEDPKATARAVLDAVAGFGPL
jgi:pilus assembly protein CpaF